MSFKFCANVDKQEMAFVCLLGSCHRLSLCLFVCQALLFHVPVNLQWCKPKGTFHFVPGKPQNSPDSLESTLSLI